MTKSKMKKTRACAHSGEVGLFFLFFVLLFSIFLSGLLALRDGRERETEKEGDSKKEKHWMDERG
jgi:hypothetical protein